MTKGAGRKLPIRVAAIVASTLVALPLVATSASAANPNGDSGNSGGIEISVPDRLITTEAANTDPSLLKVVTPGGSLTDTVHYRGLEPGKQYTLSGQFMAISDDGEATPTGVESTTTFTPSDTEGVIESTFDVPDDTIMTGSRWVAYEEITYNGHSVLKHEDSTSSRQSVFSPLIETYLRNDNDGMGRIANGGDELTETFTYRGLQPGHQYTVSGTLYSVQDDGISDTGVSSVSTFAPDDSDGAVTLSFVMPTDIPDGMTGRRWVAKNLLTLNGKEVYRSGRGLSTQSEWSDPEIANRTVYVPDVSTYLHTDEVPYSMHESVKLTDDVVFSGLQPGETYKASGVLVLPDGTHTAAKGEATFTTETINGDVSVDLTVPSGILDDGTYVATAFETITLVDTGEVVAYHRDLGDKDQQLKIIFGSGGVGVAGVGTTPPSTGSGQPQSPQEALHSDSGGWSAGAIAALAIGAIVLLLGFFVALFLFLKKHRKKNNQIPNEAFA